MPLTTSVLASFGMLGAGTSFGMSDAECCMCTRHRFPWLVCCVLLLASLWCAVLVSKCLRDCAAKVWQLHML
jgi:hypothetical protein